MKRYSLLFLLVLLGIRALSQVVYSTNPDSATLFPKTHGTFENYAFVLNGKVIEQESLVHHPGAILNNVFPYAIKLEGQSYLGAVYLHTEEKYAPPIHEADDLAYFINGRQVHRYHLRLTEAEEYTQIERSTQDTTIDGRLYKGSIHVYTNEDFFNDKIAFANKDVFAKWITLPELIKEHTNLPLEQVIVHWRTSKYRYSSEEDLGTIIRDHFPMYSFGILGVRAVEVDRIRFAEGERYVVHLVDGRYKQGKPKAVSIFENPLKVDTAFPCYVADFDQTAHAVFTSTNVPASPRHGNKDYLKRLSAAMGLPADKPNIAMTSDSMTVQFIVLEEGMLAALKSIGPEKPEHGDIRTAIKKLACVWAPAVQSGRPLKMGRNMTIFYSKDEKGNIRSLDRLDIVRPAHKMPFRKVSSNTSDSTTLFPTVHGTFENDVFMLNGAMIEHHELVNYPGARLGRILPYNTRKDNKYKNVVYFHTPWYPPSPPSQYVDDPAYFINDIQVSPYAIRSSREEEYTRIERSEQDTVIDGILYKGSIHVYTEEDFFANRITMPEVIKKYTNLPLEQVIIHWRGQFINALNPGAIIQDHFPLYYIDPRGLQEVKVDRVQFAEGERYFVNVVDKGYKFSYFTEKGFRVPHRNYMIFDDPRGFDPAGPCYLADFDTAGSVIHHHAKTEPRPFQGKAAYLKKLSTIMGLPTNKLNTATTLDSITVQFIVLGNGKLTGLESVSPEKPNHTDILQAIKQHSCVWSVAGNRRQPQVFRRKMVLFYRKDKGGNIQSLDTLEYRYNEQ